MRSSGLKRPKSDNGGGTQGYEVVYSGFVLILLCFFIMLCSFATIEEAKVSRFVKSFSLAVSVLTGGVSFDEGDIVLPPSPDLIDPKDELAGIYEDIENFVKNMNLEKQIKLIMQRRGLLMQFYDTVLFDLGSAEIRFAAQPILDKVGAIIVASNYAVRIEGHTDDLPINTPRYPSNWELSTARAVTVLRYLVERKGIAPRRVSAVGCSEFQPLVPNDTSANRAKNRRVEIILTPPASEGAADAS